MAEDQSTLTLFWERWKRYQDRLEETLTPLTDRQLALRVAPEVRSLGELLAHCVASRAWWPHSFLGEGGPDLAPLIPWDDPDAPARSAAELLAGVVALTQRRSRQCGPGRRWPRQWRPSRDRTAQLAGGRPG